MILNVVIGIVVWVVFSVFNVCDGIWFLGKYWGVGKFVVFYFLEEEIYV